MPKALVRVSWLVICFCLLGLLLISPVSATAKKLAPITGKLSKPGYTLIALADSGKASSVRVKQAKFKLRPPAKLVTLHLRAPDGTYAGPIVLGQEKNGKRALLGIKAGAKLGKVKIKGGKGYAKLSHKLAQKSIAPGRWARAERGVPIGAGNFGRVRSRDTHGGAPGDLDLDGIPNRLDIDDNGNLILDNLDRSGSASSSALALQGTWETPPNFVKSALGGWIWETANADAGGLTEARAQSLLSSNGYLIIGINAGESVELNCGGLTYCSPGGTGRVFKGDGQCCTPPSAWPSFPDQFDPDGNGLGNLVPNPSPGKGPSAFFLSHGATTSEIGTGDVLIERVTTNGETKEFPTAIQYIFGTIPALHSYSDGQGDAGTVSYPVEPPSCAEGPCPGPPGPGALENPIPVKAGPDGHVKLTLTFWRPQRTPIPGEAGYGSPGSWIDIGGLSYGISPDFEGNTCQQSAFSTSDSSLTPNPAADALASGGFTDRAQDRPASSTNTLTFTVDISECVASAGKSLHAGEVLTLSLMASACGSESCVNGNSSGPDSADQLFSIKLQ